MSDFIPAFSNDAEALACIRAAAAKMAQAVSEEEEEATRDDVFDAVLEAVQRVADDFLIQLAEEATAAAWDDK